MRSVLYLLLVFLLAAPAAADSPTTTHSPTYVELILDASGSMYNRLDDGRYRLTAAKDALTDLVRNLPDSPGLHVGLRVYGAELSPKKPGACEDSRLVVPMQGVQREALLSELRDTRARGKTPIGYSLDQALQDFPADAGSCMVVLVTDGEEVCGADLKATAARLAEHGCAVDLRVIGFDLTEEAIQGFEGVGRFENAADAEALADALRRAVDDVVTIKPLSEASLEAPETVPGGSSFEVRWTAEEGPYDYVTIVPKDAKDGTFESWAYTSAGETLTLWAAVEPGEYELRYQSERFPGKVTGRRAIRVTPVEIALSAPSEISAGQPFEIEWVGPDRSGDYVTIVPADAGEDAYKSYAYTRDGSPAKLHAPIESGEYELRYRSESESGVFARRPILIKPSAITLDAPDELAAGTKFLVEWTGPNGYGDYLTIVEANAEDGAYASYSYTQNGSPSELAAPTGPGNYEIRYQSEREGGVFARLSLTVLPLEASLEAPATVAAGSAFEVIWSGPNTSDDYITIVPVGAERGSYGSYAYTSGGSPVTLTAPAEAGNYELRFQRESDAEAVFATRPIRVE